jgi:pimeloyl-ACP methyl ester carboxylesterase
MKHHIFLIPGFFGFADLGRITYFHHVSEYLEEVFAELDFEAEITPVSTLPTASIRRRTLELLETIEKTQMASDAPIHLVGHSTGGLDARLFTTPNVSLSVDAEAEPYAERVESVVTVATPHFGTPSAAFFDDMLGEKLLYIWSLATIYTLQFGRLPVRVLMALGGVLTKLDDRIGLKNTVLDQFYDQLFTDFDKEHQVVIREFLEHIVSDQSALGQITPGGIDLFNATASDRPGVRYGSVITRAARPSFRTTVNVGLDPYRQASNAIYQIVYRITGRVKEDFPPLTPAQNDALVNAYGELPTTRDNDAMCPTLSQVYAEIIHAAKADHLDVCGHFTGPDHTPPHVDWLCSGSNFDRAGFEAMWRKVAGFVAR